MRALRVVAIAGAFVLFFGLLEELNWGFPILKSTRSWGASLAMIAVVGALSMAAEAASEWIWRRDRVTERVPRRASRVMLLLALGVALSAGTLAIAVWLQSAQ